MVRDVYSSVTEHDTTLSIGELADQAGLSRRAVRFYVQRELLPPPHGRGRGARYDVSHLARLRRIQELQDAGYSLEQIRALLTQGSAGLTQPTQEPAKKSFAELPAAPRAAAPRTDPSPASAWTRLELLPGIELHVSAELGAADRDAIDPTVLRQLQHLAARLFAPAPAHDSPTGGDQP